MTTSLTIMSYLYNRNYKIDNLLKIFSWKCSRDSVMQLCTRHLFSWYLSCLFSGLCWILLIPHFFYSITPFLSPFPQMLRFLLCWFIEKKRDIFLLRQIPMFPSFAGYGCHHITRDNFNTLDSGMLYLSPYNSPVFSNAEGKIIRHLLRDMSILISRFHKCSL